MLRPIHTRRSSLCFTQWTFNTELENFLSVETQLSTAESVLVWMSLEVQWQFWSSPQSFSSIKNAMKEDNNNNQWSRWRETSSAQMFRWQTSIILHPPSAPVRRTVATNEVMEGRGKGSRNCTTTDKRRWSVRRSLHYTAEWFEKSDEGKKYRAWCREWRSK